MNVFVIDLFKMLRCSLCRKLYLLDCPGIVPPSASDFDADCAKVLKGVVRAERLKTPSDYIHEDKRKR